MKFSNDWLRRIAFSVVVVLALPVAGAVAQPCGQLGQGSLSALDQSQQLDAGAGNSNTQTVDQNGKSSNTAPISDQQKKDSSKPVGTAAAPYEKTTGVAASRPAGAVIAPAKQKRARSILIRVSVIVGAAVAVGTVAALSKGSPSRP